ncbi:hypothetical protein V1L52_07025 [Treponema sp. HNW]|uniref:hypothetical protein n=1 Tax=Treponema sp. HNW TaxID=3116654 RepID=UPI003D09DD8F
MKYTKTAFVLLILCTMGLWFQSCKTAETAAKEKTAEVQPQDKKAAAQKTEPQKVMEKSPEDEEYSRSTSALSGTAVTFDEFQRDKTTILAIIQDLDKSMKNRDYGLWRSYLTPESISYWSNKFNLQVIATKLPKKGLTLRTLGDYFSHVFIPSRMDRKVSEIRYISPTDVKAVEVDGNKDIIYYEFEKINGRWLVKLPIL